MELDLKRLRRFAIGNIALAATVGVASAPFMRLEAALTLSGIVIAPTLLLAAALSLGALAAGVMALGRVKPTRTNVVGLLFVTMVIGGVLILALIEPSHLPIPSGTGAPTDTR